MYLEPTVHYTSNATSSDAQWATTAPNEGIVYIGPERTPYLLSFFHQLICLDVLHHAFGNRRPGERPSPKATHCLNYLRQMVLCRRDTRLEPVVDPLSEHAVGAWGEMTCSDWEAVYAAHAKNVQAS